MKRRMICQDIVSEGKFLRMSLTAQALYMHLVANADDDGCVDAYTITRMIGAKEDDLVLLNEREYITILDEKEYILWITGWQDFNWIDPRYKENSKYLPLLRAKVEGLEIVTSTKTEYNKRRYSERKMKNQIESQSTQGVHSVHTVYTQESTRADHGIGKVRKGKESIDKDNINKENINSEIQTLEKVDEFSNSKELLYWQEKVGTSIRTKHKENIAAAKRLKEMLGGADLTRAIETVRIVRADKYAGKALHMIGNYIQLEKNIELIENYRAGLEDRPRFDKSTSKSNLYVV